MDRLNLTWCNKNQITIDYGTPIIECIDQFEEYKLEKDKLSVVKFNNRPVSLHSPIIHNGDLTPLWHQTREGKRIYQQTITFMLSITWQKLFSSIKLEIGQSMEDGVYFSIKGDKPISKNQLDRVDKSMKNLIKKELPLKRLKVPYHEAVNYFKEKNRLTAVELLQFRNEPSVELYSCDGIIDFASGPLLSNTAKVSSFELHRYPPGFMLRTPDNIETGIIKPFKDNKPLFNIHNEYRQWSKILGVTCVGELNNLIESKGITDFIMVNEILHDNKIATIAKQIYENREKVRVVLIAGPSSSGKTTFTKKLATHLKVFGIHPAIIGMDDYFVPKEQTPLDKDGNFDFESINAIDIEYLNNQLLSLFNGEQIEVPIFDFKRGVRKEKGTPLKLHDNSILVMEGIHGLNEALTPKVPRDEKFMIYVSALSQLKFDDHNRVPTTDSRFLRRMVRDYNFRGQSAAGTFDMWPRVRLGENRNIFPFQGNADIAFNSSLNFEIPVLKIYADPLLRTIKPDNPFYGEAVKMQKLLKNFLTIPSQHVPSHSILREFIGGSGFRY